MNSVFVDKNELSIISPVCVKWYMQGFTPVYSFYMAICDHVSLVTVQTLAFMHDFTIRQRSSIHWQTWQFSKCFGQSITQSFFSISSVENDITQLPSYTRQFIKKLFVCCSLFCVVYKYRSNKERAFSSSTIF